MKTNNKMFLKTVIIAVLSVFTYAAKAQPNLVQNGSFESGIIQLCNSSAGWGPYWLDHVGYKVSGWTGYNIQFPSQTYNTGHLMEYNAGCSGGDIPNSMNAYDGSRVVGISLEKQSDGISGSRITGPLSSALDVGCYWVCLQVSPLTTAIMKPGIVEVVLKASGGGVPDKVIGRYNFSTTPGWVRNKSFFSIPFSSRGHYDQIHIRLDEATLQANSGSNDGGNYIIIDDVNIRACTYSADVATQQVFDYNVHIVTDGGGIPVIGSITGNATTNEEMVVFHWDLEKGEGSDPDGEWTLLDENCVTDITPSYNSGPIGQAEAGDYFKLSLTEITPCVGRRGNWVIVRVDPEGILEQVSYGAFDASYEPTGEEFGEPEGMGKMPGGTDMGTNEQNIFELSPNPPTDRISIGTIDNNPAHLATAKCSVFDAKGALIIRDKDISVNNTLDITALPTGIYYIRIINAEKVEVQKFYKK